MRFTTGLLLAALISPLAQADLIDEVNERGELRIAVQPDTRPLYFKEGEQATGFIVELGQALARELDVRVSFVEASEPELLEGVESGKYDMTLQQGEPAGELEERVDASNPYTPHGSKPLVAVFQKGSPAFRNSVNNALQRVEADAQFKLVAQKWFGPLQNVPVNSLKP